MLLCLPFSASAFFGPRVPPPELFQSSSHHVRLGPLPVAGRKPNATIGSVSCMSDSNMSGPQGFVIGTAGHIDHGKTSLIRALTGIDTDRLAEEKRRGISIDLGFAHFTLDGHPISFIDVPGHERFIKNMLAGAAGIHAVLLIVA